MDGVGAGAVGCVEDGFDVQVGLGDGGGADVDGFVGHLDVQGVGVGFAVDCYGAVAQGLGGALDAAGDFATVGYEDFVEHE